MDKPNKNEYVLPDLIVKDRRYEKLSHCTTRWAKWAELSVMILLRTLVDEGLPTCVHRAKTISILFSPFFDLLIKSSAQVRKRKQAAPARPNRPLTAKAINY